MIGAEGQERRGSALKSLAEHLHDPTKLRLVVAAVVLGIGYMAVYVPIQNNIALTTTKLGEAQRQLVLAGEVEALRRQFRAIQPRIPSGGDANEWMQYVLTTLRQSPLKITTFSPARPLPFGDYQLLTITVNLSGTFKELDRFLFWLELSNPRLFRVDTISLSPGSSQSEEMNMNITVSGIMG